MAVYPDNHKYLGPKPKGAPGTVFKKGDPKLLVIHYTAGGTGPGIASDLHNGRLSVHFVVDRNGDVYQCADTTRVCWHCGPSAWEGLKGCNNYAIGIEHINLGWWGPERKLPKTKFTFVGKHKNGGPWDHWEPYPEAQIQASLKLSGWIIAQHPTIRWIVGHDDISPGRKQDPGPAFPWKEFAYLREAVAAANNGD